MERVRGANGQFADAELATDAEDLKDGEARRAKRTRIPVLRRNARRAFARALPLIVETLIQEAKAGSVAHVKLLLQMEKDLLATPAGEQKGKSLEAILQAQWKEDAALYGPRRDEFAN